MNLDAQSGLNRPQKSPAWCSCGNWLIGSEHSCDDCEETDWMAHNNCGHNRAKAKA